MTRILTDVTFFYMYTSVEDFHNSMKKKIIVLNSYVMDCSKFI